MGGYVLGAATAALGYQAAMACTAAVEEVIDAHYQEQLAQLPEGALATTIEQFRQEELEHKETAEQQGAADAPFAGLLQMVVKTISRTAIIAAKRF
jgi:3-demethoxyubiquinol 3-hydroxylase